MNNGTFEWSEEQVEAYARAFRAGDAVRVGGEWVKVHHLDESCALSTETPFQITTLAEYKLQGGEKMIWLGPTDRYRTFGKVYTACNYFDTFGKWFIAYSRDNDGGLVKPKADNPWGVIPRYKNCKSGE